MIKRTILCIDNDTKMLEMYRRLLAGRGYEVLMADKLADAERMLVNEMFHLVIHDIRMMNDHDLNDFTGLSLVGRVPGIPGIVVTIDDRLDTAVEAFRAMAVDFITKKELEGGVTPLLSRIDREFADKIPVNFDLVIPDETAKILRWLLSGLDCAPSQMDEIQLWTRHLENIFRQLFYESKNGEQKFVKIVAQQLDQGRGGSAIVLIKPITNVTQPDFANDVVVKFGLKEDIRDEVARYNKFVKDLLSARVTEIGKPCESGRLGAVPYSFAGGSGKGIQTFADYFKANTVNSLRQTLTDLFLETCGKWYGHTIPCSERVDSLYAHHYGLDIERRFERIMESIRQYCYIDKPGFRIAEETASHRVIVEYRAKSPVLLPDPIHNFKTGIAEHVKAEHLSVVHGDMNTGNVLVDTHGMAWLIDFARTTDKGPLFMDFAELETIVRIDLILEEDLNSLFEFEAALASQRDFGTCPSLPTSLQTNEKIAKGHAIVAILRDLAGQCFKGVSMRQYYVGLLANNLNKLAMREELL